MSRTRRPAHRRSIVSRIVTGRTSYQIGTPGRATVVNGRIVHREPTVWRDRPAKHRAA